MCSRLHLAALGGLLLAALQTPKAESRSSAMQVRVNVVRACSVETRGGGEPGTIALTCNGGSTPGVVSAGSGATARIVPVPTRQTTIVAAHPIRQSVTGPERTAAETPVRQIVTVNF
jgi:hypothetical protein